MENLNKLSVTELKRLQTRIDAEIARRNDTTRKLLLKKMEKMASEAGLSLHDLVGKPTEKGAKRVAKMAKKVVKGAGAKVKPKYRHPEKLELTWTGRGRKPQWVTDWLTAGKSLDGLLIPATAA